MKNKTWDLSHQNWQLSGLTPEAWRLQKSLEIGFVFEAEVGPVPAQVPGSVQRALLQAGLLPDWNLGLQHRLCEWVENRQWLFECDFPDFGTGQGSRFSLVCRGLDSKGLILLDGNIVAQFDSAFHPFELDLTEAMTGAAPKKLGILLEQPPRWLGQFGRTSLMHDQKPRFNFTWDWMPRLVQIGIWDRVEIRQWNAARLTHLGARTDFSPENGLGTVILGAEVELAAEGDGFTIEYELRDGQKIIASGKTSAQTAASTSFEVTGAEPWWPHGLGKPKLYFLSVRLLDPTGTQVYQHQQRIGFRKIEWRACAGAPPEADPWICVVNNVPIFLQGVNWTPIRPNFADTPDADYQRLVADYQRMGCNTLRVWGGAARERDLFYDLCDELGILVWQEFPLSSSGVENAPPHAPLAMKAFMEAAQWAVKSLRHHPSILLWCGGNELTEDVGDSPARIPCTGKEPLLVAFADLVREENPERRFVPTSPSGPSFGAAEKDYGRGIHWETHGPWKMDEKSLAGWEVYWKGDDSLFRSEVGCPGASSAHLTESHAGGEEVFPARNQLVLWRRTPWWTEWETACQELGHAPATLAEYVAWSQNRQAMGLRIAAESCKNRFPKCGGFLVWMGHDAFPCTANTSIIEFDGTWKPAAHSLQTVFTGSGSKT